MNKQRLTAQRVRWQHFIAQAQTFWKALALREKRMVLGTALVLGSLLVWLLLIQPPLKQIDYWQAETPKLRTQTQTLQTLLQDVAPAASASTGASIEQRWRGVLDAAGLAGHYQLQAPGAAAPLEWSLTFDDAPADAAIGVLLASLGQFSMEVVEARLQRAGDAEPDEAAGKLSGTVRMNQAPTAKEAS
ncbi:type II secretion system protein M [Pseudomonas syringae]|nr:type II secretion system protein M [Pseudomonas syringae]